MGPSTSAAILGLAAASAQKKISRGISSNLSLFKRSSSNLAATDVGEKKDMKSESESLKITKEKSLYLCFRELNRYSSETYTNQVVRPIKLNSNDGDDDEEEEYLYLGEAAYKRYNYDLNRCYCSTFGSQIVFPDGPNNTQICSIDTSTRPIKFSQPITCPNSLKTAETNLKHNVVLGEVDGKLYRIIKKKIGFYRYFNSFEVFDPENVDKWRRLKEPRFMLDLVTFLNASKKILGWQLEKPGVICFDASKPENGWNEVPPELGNKLPFMIYKYYNRPLFIHNHHPDLGDFHLTFYYDPQNEPLIVSAFFLSNNFDSFHPINKPIQLPAICREYLHLFCPSETFVSVVSEFQFVRLGARKVGLVLNKFFGNEYCRYRGMFLLITFEYDIIITTTVEYSKPTLEIQTRLLGTRRFRYHSKRPVRKDPSYSVTNLNGAFLI